MPQPRFSFSRRLLPALLFALLPVALTGQARTGQVRTGPVREVVSNQLAISQTEAGLVLEFADDGLLEIALRDGVVVVDRGIVGNFDRGDPLDTAWRELLGEIVNLSDGALGEALRDWAPPSSLSGSDLTTAQLLDESLEEALGARVQTGPDAERDIDISAGLGLSLQALLSRVDNLGELGQALEAIDMLHSSIHIGEDVVVAEDETIEGNIIVVDGDLTVNGTIEEDVVIVGGSITVRDGGDVHGDIRLVDSRYFGIDESALEGRVIRVDSDDSDFDLSADFGDFGDLEDLEDLKDRIRDEIRSELRHELRDVGRGFSPFLAVGRGVAEVMGDLISFLILSLIALGVVYFAKDNLEVVADTARWNPMRAGMVGLAGAFLVLPTWLLGCVALVVSVVGIVALPFWLLLFPIAVALGAGLGFLAAAKNIGEWVAEREISGLEWIQPTNTFYAVVTGVGTVLAFSLAANVLDIVPFFGFFSGLIAMLGSMITVAALLVGFGAVLLTRGGRQAEFYGGGDPFGDEPAWEEDGISEEVIEAEEVRDEPRDGADSEDMAEATADAADETTDEAGDTGDADDA